MYTSTGERWNMVNMLLFGASNYGLTRAAREFTLNDLFFFFFLAEMLFITLSSPVANFFLW